MKDDYQINFNYQSKFVNSNF